MRVAKRIAKNLVEVGGTALDLATGRYPSFVYGAGIAPGRIPVFCFHSAEPDLFERRLAFLAENGYVTLTADEYLSVMRGEATAPPKAVVLTFDDGWGSLWSIGYPVLRKYGLKIVVFLITGRIENVPSVVGADSDPRSRIGIRSYNNRGQAGWDRDSSEHPLLTWEEIAEMHESGLVDFQSHSYSHSLIPRSARIVDFVNPELLRACNLLELPACGRRLQSANLDPLTTPVVGAGPDDWSRQGIEKGVCPLFLGEPLYESAPRLSDAPRVFPPACIRDECISIVEAHGPDFFDRPDWRSHLWEVVQKHVVTSDELSAESEAERTSAIWMELFDSRRLIEEHLPGKEVRHICFPWHVAGRTALGMALEAGYQLGWMGKVDRRYFTGGRGSVQAIQRLGRSLALPRQARGGDQSPVQAPDRPTLAPRIGGDFFFRLPGKGRVSLARILLGKFARRIRQGSPYLTH